MPFSVGECAESDHCSRMQSGAGHIVTFAFRDTEFVVGVGEKLFRSVPLMQPSYLVMLVLGKIDILKTTKTLLRIMQSPARVSDGKSRLAFLIEMPASHIWQCLIRRSLVCDSSRKVRVFSIINPPVEFWIV